VFPLKAGLKYPFQNRPFSEAIDHSAELLRDLEFLSLRKCTAVINFYEVIPDATRGDTLEIGRTAYQENTGMLQNPIFVSVTKGTFYSQIGRWLYSLLREKGLGNMELVLLTSRLVYYNTAWGMGVLVHVRSFGANMFYVSNCLFGKILGR
jgi:hypothetical protein